MTEAQNIISGFRAALQDLLIPELKSIKTEIGYMQKAIDANTLEMKELRTEMRSDLKSLRSDLREDMQIFRDTIVQLIARLDTTQKLTELAERIAKLEQKVNI